MKKDGPTFLEFLNTLVLLVIGALGFMVLWVCLGTGGDGLPPSLSVIWIGLYGIAAGHYLETVVFKK